MAIARGGITSPMPTPITKEPGSAKTRRMPSSKAMKVMSGPIAVPNMAMSA